jgi:histidine ammonia-lyase
MPQVHGAAHAALEWAWTNLEVELNSVQDNPCVAFEGEALISNGNMDGTLLTLSFDNLRSALVAAVDIGAQRLHKLHWPAFSGLPAGLAAEESALGGVQFLNLSHIAEAYAAAARRRANPSLLNYHGQLADGVEDHATLLPLAVLDTEQLIDSAWVVQALEIIISCWAIRRRGLEVESLGEGLREVYSRVEPLLPIGREGAEVFDLRPLVALARDEQLVDLIDDEAPPLPDFESPVVPAPD